MDPFKEHQQNLTRRLFFNRSGISLGSAALAWMLHNEKAQSKSTNNTTPTQTAHTDIPHFKPRAKRIIYLFQSGAPRWIYLISNRLFRVEEQPNFLTQSDVDNGSLE